MGRVKIPAPAKLIVGMIAPSPSKFADAQVCLTKKYGGIDYESSVIPFNCTDHYAWEMGENLLRKFISFRDLISPSSLPEVKIHTNGLEGTLSDNPEKRSINLDPGYITLAKLVLATTKNHSHRIYIGKGIYAEVTLSYRDGSFQPLPWTYPDYRKKKYHKIFEEIRTILRAVSPSPGVPAQL